MRFGVLGPLEVTLDGRALPLGGPKQRAVLAILLLRANEPVSRDRLIDAVWGERAPSEAQRSIDSYVSRLRAQLGAGRLTRSASGYTLGVEPGESDLERFEARLGSGLASAATGDARAAAAALREALSLWRGPALADLVSEPFAASAIEWLQDRRLLAIEALNEARLALGEDAELIGELTGLVREHPYRERLLGQLMLALYRAGRQTEALAAFRRGKATLREELGLEPGAELQELERRILKHDPPLVLTRPERPAMPARAPALRGTRRGLAVGITAVVAVAIAVLVLTGRHAPGPSARANELVGLGSDPGHPLVIGLAGTPSIVAAGAGALWVADANDGSLTRIDPLRHSIVDRIPIGGSPGAIAVGGGFVWVASVPGDSVARVDPATGTVSQRIPLGGARVAALAFGGGGLWVADATDDSLIELDPISGSVRRTVTLDLRPTAVVVGRSGIWVADYGNHDVAEVDPDSGETVETIAVGMGPAALALAGGDLWVANALDSTVSRIDPIRGAVTTVVPVGSGPTALAVTPGSVWVANEYSSTVSRIDTTRTVVTRTVPVDGLPTTAAVSHGRLWIGVRPERLRRGGTLRLVHSRPLLIDPALQADLPPPQSDGLTRDGLVTYEQVSGAAGTQIVPDLALSIPTPSDGGTTYTFRLRPGIRYSDGRVVRASDFRRALERVFDLRSWGTDVFSGVRGAAACVTLDDGHCDLSRGIVTNDPARTVAFRLVAADPDFLAKLTTGGLATPVPPGTPLDRSPAAPIAGTGPYEIASASKREIRYVRNPYFREWSHAAQPAGYPNEIVWRFGASPADEVGEVERGVADWTADSVPGRLLPAVAARRPGQLHTFATTETDFFQLNTIRPPFDDVRVRRALNLALDRRVIVRLYGGAIASAPTCQVLPPGLSGYRRYCPYTIRPGRAGRWIGPDLARAKRLVAASGKRGERVTVWGWVDDPTLSPAVAAYTAEVLRSLGFRSRVRLIRHSDFDSLPESVRRTVQLIPGGWLDTSPAGFVLQWLSCRGVSDHGFFCEPAIDRLMRRAARADATDPHAGAALWAQVDHELVDRAAWLPLVNERQTDFVSARVKNFQHHPYWDVLADQFVLK